MALSSLQRCVCHPTRYTIVLSKISIKGRSLHYLKHDTDSCGIPLQPTWSVNQLLSSYPSPKLSSSTVNRLYELSALIHPKEGTPQYEIVKSDLEEMVKLVEAVRLVDTSGITVSGRGEKEDADRQIPQVIESETNGQALLEHASQTTEYYYVVDSERKR